MEYKAILESLLQTKVIDPRFHSPAYFIPSPDITKAGVLDERYHQALPKKSGIQSDYYYKGIPIGSIRDAMNCENVNIAENLIEESILHVQFNDHIVNIYMYRPFHRKEKLPCIVYYHGGAYLGGSVKVTANISRALCDRLQAVVFDVDYRLAPEYPYPSSSDDCYGCFNWICDHADQYLIDEQQLYVAGDSAGGNFVINSCIREYELELYRIKGCLLYYPHVSMIETKEYPWDISMYDMDDSQKVEITKDILWLREIVRASEFYYLQSRIVKGNPLVSPLFYERLHGLPPTLIISAEFDYLRIQQEYFFQKLQDVGVDVKYLQYQGMQHAFLDQIGYHPQAEAVIIETKAFIDEINKKK